MIILNCPSCDSTSFTAFTSDKVTFKFHKCNECALVFQHPLPSQAELLQHYESYDLTPTRVSDDLVRQRRISYVSDISFLQSSLELINSSVDKLSSVFDYGASQGFYLEEYIRSGVPKAFGWDYGNHAAQILKEKSFFLDIFEQPPTYFQLLTMRGVIEHILNPFELVPNLVDKMKPDFIYISATPNGSSICSHLYRENWRMHVPKEHLWHFSPHHLVKLFAGSGYCLLNLCYPYLQTPYENLCIDSKLVYNYCQHPNYNALQEMVSPPFFDTMMSLIFVRHDVL